ncbi:hypothetical protein QD357_01855 [Rhizobium sp. BR 317]|uniref:hypothetical protein n=1 Tax=Rhizobium sp. BR 317 TaxID=3040015 RepID=UPI0039BFC652
MFRVLPLVVYIGTIAVAIVCMFPSSPAAARFGDANSDGPRSNGGGVATQYAVVRNGKYEEL